MSVNKMRLFLRRLRKLNDCIKDWRYKTLKRKLILTETFKDKMHEKGKKLGKNQQTMRELLLMYLFSKFKKERKMNPHDAYPNCSFKQLFSFGRSRSLGDFGRF